MHVYLQRIIAQSNVFAECNTMSTGVAVNKICHLGIIIFEPGGAVTMGLINFIISQFT